MASWMVVSGRWIGILHEDMIERTEELRLESTHFFDNLTSLAALNLVQLLPYW